jgi:antitoxin (DNA-binding transcriptional repressor) of toxin-antitoxin stability system
MDRIEIPMEGDVARWVEAAQRGDEVVFTHEGEVLASVTPRARFKHDRDALAAMRDAAKPLLVNDATLLVREMRDMDDH